MSSGPRTRSSSSARPSTTAGPRRSSRPASSTPSSSSRPGIAPVLIVTGGKAGGDRTTEAAAARTWADGARRPGRGDPGEDHGRTTLESLEAVAAILRAHNLTARSSCSDRTHMLPRPPDGDRPGHRRLGLADDDEPDRRAMPSSRHGGHAPRARGPGRLLRRRRVTPSRPRGRRRGAPAARSGDETGDRPDALPLLASRASGTYTPVNLPEDRDARASSRQPPRSPHAPCPRCCERRDS